MNIASYIDHTLLKPTASEQEINKLCSEAIQYSFAAVCVPPTWVPLAGKNISGSAVKLATVIGFPFGYADPSAKRAESIQALADGANELDMVINLIALRRADWDWLKREINEILEIAHQGRALVKVIIESGILSNAEIIACCQMYSEAGVDFLKTSTGYAERGATIEAVQLMKGHLPDRVRIKASGGIKTYAFALELINAGASRIGCSASVAIVNGAPQTEHHGY